mmetsp:Transcript_29464/g.30577  ORF Transcript_29464/g.30577 Transcript_29464/m.30577 type:complete len:174 (-) Transcript_29464:59-580(-)
MLEKKKTQVKRRKGSKVIKQAINNLINLHKLVLIKLVGVQAGAMSGILHKKINTMVIKLQKISLTNLEEATSLFQDKATLKTEKRFKMLIKEDTIKEFKMEKMKEVILMVVTEGMIQKGNRQEEKESVLLIKNHKLMVAIIMVLILHRIHISNRKNTQKRNLNIILQSQKKPL